MNYSLENCPITLNTTRICENNALETAIKISKMGFSNMKPNAVILVNKNDVFHGIAATSLVHFPINAALLFTDGKRLSKETLKEIQRLSPKGYKGIHVILVGNITKNVSSELNSCGFKTHHMAGCSHYETACIIPNVRKEFKNVLIVSGEDYSEGITAGYWAAHHGDPILFVQKKRIPQCTLDTIKKMNGINIYIIGSARTISKEVEKYLCNMDSVKNLTRIDGNTPYDIAVNFAIFKDGKTEFGWGRNYRGGHAFTFGDLNNPMEIIAGALFAHMGKHTPPLLVERDKIPAVVERYIKSIKPLPHKDMPKPPFMHGFILGNTEIISYEAQVTIETFLSIGHEMKGHMDHEMMYQMDHEMKEHIEHGMMDHMDNEMKGHMGQGMMCHMDDEMKDQMDQGMMHHMDDEMKGHMDQGMMYQMGHEMKDNMDHGMMCQMGHEMKDNMDHGMMCHMCDEMKDQMDHGMMHHMDDKMEGHMGHGIMDHMDDEMKGHMDQGMMCHMDDKMEGHMDQGMICHMDDEMKGHMYHMYDEMEGHMDQGMMCHMDDEMKDHMYHMYDEMEGHMDHGMMHHMYDEMKGHMDHGMMCHMNDEMKENMDYGMMCHMNHEMADYMEHGTTENMKYDNTGELGAYAKNKIIKELDYNKINEEDDKENLHLKFITVSTDKITD